VDTENGWILVRPSGTEPRIRITAEARKGVEELFRKAEILVRDSL
jgi:phosphoglucosamine mutase